MNPDRYNRLENQSELIHSVTDKTFYSESYSPDKREHEKIFLKLLRLRSLFRNDMAFAKRAKRVIDNMGNVHEVELLFLVSQIYHQFKYKEYYVMTQTNEAVGKPKSFVQLLRESALANNNYFSQVIMQQIKLHYIADGNCDVQKNNLPTLTILIDKCFKPSRMR